ncbi:MAG: hypothetical protein K0S65_3083, partial [Labilithrix sp.]|nr:hypothetical protein [Labilithrix sp.]
MPPLRAQACKLLQKWRWKRGVRLEHRQLSGFVRGKMKRTFFSRDPGIDPGPGSGDLAASRPERAVVGNGHDLFETNPSSHECSDEPIGSSDGGEEPETGPPERPERSPLAVRPADFHRGRVYRHHVIRLGEQELARRTKIARGRKTTTAPRPPGIDREDRERMRVRAAAATNTERSVEHDHIRTRHERRGMIDRGLTCGPDDNLYQRRKRAG